MAMMLSGLFLIGVSAWGSPIVDPKAAVPVTPDKGYLLGRAHLAADKVVLALGDPETPADKIVAIALEVPSQAAGCLHGWAVGESQLEVERVRCPGFFRITPATGAKVKLTVNGEDRAIAVKLAPPGETLAKGLLLTSAGPTQLWLETPPPDPDLAVFTGDWGTCTAVATAETPPPKGMPPTAKAYDCADDAMVAALTGADTSKVWLRGAVARDAKHEETFQYAVELAKKPTASATVFTCDILQLDTTQISDRAQVVCLDHARDVRSSATAVIYGPEVGGARSAASNLEAGVATWVVVGRPDGVTTVIDDTGTIGLSSGIALQSGARDNAAGKLVPPQAGKELKIEVKFSGMKEDPKAVTHTYRFLVERHIKAIVRVGIGAAYAIAPAAHAPVDRYAVENLDGSDTDVIVDRGRDRWVEGEVTVGLSTFVKALAESRLSKAQVSVYLGVGLLKLQQNSNLVSIPSVHLGPELTIGRTLGLAATVGARTRTALAEGVEPGQFAPSSTLPTRIVGEPVVGLVVSMSPETFALFTTGKK